nr:immunoglobulin light chain junction region [Macaca mulatta]MOW16943.1 immunoglobulin light chain junction region [Macaca mulatta]
DYYCNSYAGSGAFIF